MKKTILSALFAIMALTASAQKEIFSCSFVGGYAHTSEPKIGTGEFGACLTFYNVYLDVIFKPAEKSTSTDVGVWGNQSSVYNYHVGYRIATKGGKFGIIPIVGATTASVGYVDGWDWKIDETYGVVNKFNATTKKTYFDAGIVLDYSCKKAGGIGLKLLAGATIHNVFAGVGIAM